MQQVETRPSTSSCWRLASGCVHASVNTRQHVDNVTRKAPNELPVEPPCEGAMGISDPCHGFERERLNWLELII